MINLNFSSKTYYLFTGIWAICILVATLASSSTFEHFHLSGLFGFDKPIHFILFGIQAWLLVKSITKNKTKNLMKIVFFSCLGCSFYGAFTEILQGIFVWLGRGFDYDDIAADALGSFTVFGWFWFKRKQFAQ